MHRRGWRVRGVAWAFPRLQADERAFIAFGQHFAVRHVLTNNLSTNPYYNYSEIVAASFPGAKSVGGAFLIAPATYLGFLAGNAWDTLATSFGFVGKAIWPAGIELQWRLLALALLLCRPMDRHKKGLSARAPRGKRRVLVST